MKQFVLVFFLSFSVLAFSQIQLKYETHSLKENEVNHMVIANFVDPGISGPNVVWDFSGMKKENLFEGSIEASAKSVHNLRFEEANIVLDEFGNKFFFQTNESSTLAYGMISKSGSTLIKYDQPYVKMRFPFTYGNQFGGNYSGTFSNQTDVLGTIEADYLVLADGYGKLILPNAEYKSALRVKTIRNITRKIKNFSYNVIHETYRWYVENHRFPVLVLSSTSILNGKSISKSYQSAYNSNVREVLVSEQNSLTGEELYLYPNPADNYLTIDFNVLIDSRITMELFDVSGKKLALILDENKAKGFYTYTYTLDAGLKPGFYFVRFQAGDVSKLIKFSKK